MTATHFTAWLTIDRTCLEGDFCDVIVLQDEAITSHVAYNGTETPVWASNGPEMLYALTGVRHDGNTDGAQGEAEDILADAGWRTVGDWEQTDHGYIVTVEPAN